MRKREFLKELRIRLNRIEYRDVEDVIAYYDELIEDTIDRTGKREEEVVADLGPISEIVLRVNPNKGSSAGKEEKIKYDEYEERQEKKVHKTKQQSGGSAAGIIVALLTSPIWLGILIILIAVIIGAIGAGIGIAIAGIACIGYGITTFGAGFANALFQIGTGIILIGLTFVLAPLLIKIISWLMKLIVKFVKWLFGVSSERKRACYEN